jgi:hypothetical protein
MKLKEEIKPLVKKKQCVSRLALKFNVCGRAIERAIDRNVDGSYLVSIAGLAVIRKHTGLTTKEIVE